MVCSGIPGLTLDAVQYMESQLWLDCSASQASAQFTRLIEESIRSICSRLNFFSHAVVQRISGTQPPQASDDPACLSFVPTLYR